MSTQPSNIVILGAGYAGLLATTRLAGKVRHQNVAITLINASDVFVERLRLHQFAANQALAQRPIANILKGTGITFVRGVVTHFHPAQRELVVQTDTATQRVRYGLSSRNLCRRRCRLPG